jgi:ubiquinone/menaquinone biosynthesis C-methylase UbiE
MCVSSGYTTVARETADVETSSEDYARRFSGKVGAYFLEVQTSTVLDLLEPWPNAQVLDVGGGHAQVAVPLVEHGFDVTVIGSDPVCRNRLDRFLEAGSFSFKSGNILPLPYDDKSFDIVTAFRLLPHVNNWEKLISEMSRVASTAIIVDYPEKRSFNFLSKQLFKAKKAIEGNTRPYRCFTRKEVLTQFSLHGFTSATWRSEFFVPMAIHRALGLESASRGAERICRMLGLTHFFGSPVILRVSPGVKQFISIGKN